MLPKAERRDIDWDILEAAVMKRKEALLSKYSKASTKSKSASKRSRRS